jgi:xylulokinase
LEANASRCISKGSGNPTSSEGGALGVAILAGVGTGVYQSIEEACRHLVKVKDSTKPGSDSYNVNYHKYRKLYERLKDLF